MEKVKNNTVFYVVNPYTDSVECQFRSMGRNTLAEILKDGSIIFSAIVFLHKGKDAELASCLAEEAKQIQNIATSLLEIPFGTKDDQDRIAEFYYDFATTWPFDYENNEYYIFFDSLEAMSRIFMYYLNTMQMIKISLIAITPQNDFYPYQTKMYIASGDLSYYMAISRQIQQNKADSVAYLKSGIETINPQFNALIERIEQVAMYSRQPVLLCGETGTGKSQLARRIYDIKVARGLCLGKFVELNCAAIRGDMAQSLLFGHIRGSYTGAAQNREGLLRTANEGVLFLDEIGALGLEEQALLLKAIERQTFYPVGSDKEVSSKFMLLCGTNADLYEEVKQGRFRSDLLARINTWAFVLPPLRCRREDIPANLKFEVSQYAAAFGKHIVFTEDAQKIYLDYAMSAEEQWFSNFRGFSNSIHRMCTFARKGIIDKPIVEEEIERLRVLGGMLQPTELFTSTGTLLAFPLLNTLLGMRTDELDRFDAVQLEYVLNVCISSKSLSDAGRKLFSVSRLKKDHKNDADRLKKYLDRYAIAWRDIEMLPVS